MKSFGSIISELNPMDHLGERKYSYKFPFLLTLLACIFIEIYIHVIVRSTDSLATLAILIPLALIVYFSFRDGIIGGLASTAVTIAYYFYIIYTLHYSGKQFSSGVITTVVLGILYGLLAEIIGGLKQRIDVLMEQERVARHAAEEGNLRLHTILQQLPVGVLIANAKDKKIESNRYMEKILGKKIGQSIQRDENYISPIAYKFQKPLPQNKWPITRALNHGEVVLGEEIEYVRNDRKHIFLRVNAAPIKGLKGEIIAAVSTLYDVTRIKELEMRKDDFVNMASHELKTPITSINLYIDSLIFLTKNQSDRALKKIANNIKIQTDKLQKLVNDLLDVSRLQTGKLSFNKKKFRLDNLINEAIDQLQLTTSQEIIFQNNVPTIVNADSFRIYQVITNLISNAIKYSRHQGDIIISLEKDAKQVVVSVKDMGIGIAKDQQDKIFNRLYQVNNDKGKTFPGFGMGLYISREIIQRHRGSIWVISEEGNGSTFYFSLPRVKKNKSL